MLIEACRDAADRRAGHMCTASEYADLDHVVHRCASGVQDRLAIGERLPRLFTNRRAGEVSGAHVDVDQTRDLQVLSRFHP